MRLAIILLLLVFAAVGAVFGALNGDRVAWDFYFFVVQFPKGAALLCALLVGWFVGGVAVYVGLVMRLRRRVRKLSRELKRREANEESAVPAPPPSSAS
jgi:lipopolysaccharide assembly protein A